MIKQMSLIALGAATLFMAPTVVHAAADTGTVKNRVAEVGIVDDPTGENVITKAPSITFNSVSNKLVQNATLQTATDSLEVKIGETASDWEVHVGMTEFKTNEGWNLKHSGLYLDGTLVSSQKYTNSIPNHYNDGLTTDGSNIVMDSVGPSLGTHTMTVGSGAMLEKIQPLAPKGIYKSTLVWTLQDKA